MTRSKLSRVRIRPGAWSTWGVAGSLPAGAILVLEGGTILRIRSDGELDELLPPGHPRPGCSHAVATSRRRP
jgi:hypothetical protein